MSTDNIASIIKSTNSSTKSSSINAPISPPNSPSSASFIPGKSDQDAEKKFNELMKNSGKREVYKNDLKAKVALESWKSNFFALLNETHQEIIKKTMMIKHHPWILTNEIPEPSKKSKKKGTETSNLSSSKAKKTVSASEAILQSGGDRDANGLGEEIELKDVKNISVDDEPHVIKVNFSRLQLLIKRNIHELESHLNIVKNLHSQIRQMESSSIHGLGSTSSSSLNTMANQEKNPLFRALFKLTDEEREALILFFDKSLESCNIENDLVENNTTAEALKAKRDQESKLTLSEKIKLQEAENTKKTNVLNARKDGTLKKPVQFFNWKSKESTTIDLELGELSQETEERTSTSPLSSYFKSETYTFRDTSSSNMHNLTPEEKTQKELKEIKAGNKIIDQQLESVAYGVAQLKVIAKDIDKEVVSQNSEILPNTEMKIDTVDVQMAIAHNKVLLILKKMKKGHMLIYIFLCLVLFGLAIYLFKVIFES